MAGAFVSEAELGKDSIDGIDRRQWFDPHGFYFLDYGIGPAWFAPIVEIESCRCDDFPDFNLAERRVVHRVCC